MTPRLALLLSLPPLLWAGNAVLGHALAGQVPPLALNFLRWLLVFMILLPLAWRALLPLSRLRTRWRYLLPVGLLGVGFFNSLQYLALVSSTPLNVTLVAASMPVWMLALGSLFFGQHPTRRELLGAAVGLAGVLVVLGRGSLQTLLAVRFVPGDFFILAAVIGWALYSWLLARPPAHMQGEQRPAEWDWAGFLLVQVVFGLAGSAVFALGEQAVGVPPIAWSPGIAAALLYVSIGASIVAYRCWGLGVAEGGPALAAFFNNLTPLFAALFSALWLGQAPQAYHALGFACIVGGIVVARAGARR